MIAEILIMTLACWRPALPAYLPRPRLRNTGRARPSAGFDHGGREVSEIIERMAMAIWELRRQRASKAGIELAKWEDELKGLRQGRQGRGPGFA
jgi:hypothetical protein